MAFDGSIVIDTRLDTSGMQGELQHLASTAATGMNEVTAAVNAAGSSMGASLQEKALSIQGTFDSVKDTFLGLWNQIKAENEGPMAEFFGLFAQSSQHLVDEFNQGGLSQLSGMVGNELNRLIQRIGEKLPEFLQGGMDILQNLLNGLAANASQIAQGAVTIIGSLVDGLSANLPQILNAAVMIITELANGLATGLPTLLPQIANCIVVIAQALVDNIEPILNAAVELIMGLVNGLLDAIPILMDAMPTIVTSLVQGLLAALPNIIDAGIELISALAEAIPQSIDTIVEQIPQVIDSIINSLLGSLPEIIQCGIDLLMALIQALPTVLVSIASAMSQIITSIVGALVGNIDKIILAGVQLFVALIQNLPQIIVEICKAAILIVDGLINAFFSLRTKVQEIGLDLLQGIWTGIQNSWNWLLGKLKEWCGSVLNSIKGFFGIQSPSKVMRDEVGKMLGLGLAEGIEESGDDVVEAFDAVLERLDYQRDFDLIGDAEYYAQLEKYRDQYLTKGTKQYLDASKKIYDYRKKAEQDAIKREFDGLKKQLDLGVIEERDYYDRLAELRDQYFEQGSEEWEDYTYEIAKYNNEVIEEQKKAIEEIYSSIAEEAQRSLEDIDKDIEAMAKKLKSYGGDIVQTLTFKDINGEEMEYQQLRDFAADRKAVEAYKDALLAVRARGGVPDEFFSLLRDMSVEDGTQTAKMLLELTDREFQEYVQQWQDYQKDADTIAGMLYGEEKKRLQDAYDAEGIADQFREKLGEAFDEIPEDFFENGKLASEKFGEGFVAEMDKIVEDLVQLIGGKVSSVVTSGSMGLLAGGVGSSAALQAAGSTAYYNSTFNVGTYKNTPSEQIAMWKNAMTIQRMRGEM